jgi:hypothetical protein
LRDQLALYDLSPPPEIQVIEGTLYVQQAWLAL